MSDNRANAVVNTTLRGTLVRSGCAWPLPIDDRSYGFWHVVDDLFLGDKISLPKTKQRRTIRLSVIVVGGGHTFRDKVCCQPSQDYWLPIQAVCPECEEKGALDISVLANNNDTYFTRQCSREHSFPQDMTDDYLDRNLGAWFRRPTREAGEAP